MKTLRRLLELKFDFGISFFLDEMQYATLYKIERDVQSDSQGEHGNITLHFDPYKDYPLDSKAADWVDVSELNNFKGIYYDSNKIHPTGLAKNWFGRIILVSFVIYDSNDKDE